MCYGSGMICMFDSTLNKSIKMCPNCFHNLSISRNKLGKYNFSILQKCSYTCSPWHVKTKIMRAQVKNSVRLGDVKFLVTSFQK